MVTRLHEAAIDSLSSPLAPPNSSIPQAQELKLHHLHQLHQRIHLSEVENEALRCTAKGATSELTEEQQHHHETRAALELLERELSAKNDELQNMHDNLRALEEKLAASASEQQDHMRQLQEQERRHDAEAATAVRVQEELAAQVAQLKEALWRENAAVARTMAAMLEPNENVLSPETGMRTLR